METEALLAKVGALPDSGESGPQGTITRKAVRLAREKHRPGMAIPLCLPLYGVGDGGERDFARKVPVIAPDGCPKARARDFAPGQTPEETGSLFQLSFNGVRTPVLLSAHLTSVLRSGRWRVAD